MPIVAVSNIWDGITLHQIKVSQKNVAVCGCVDVCLGGGGEKPKPGTQLEIKKSQVPQLLLH